MQNRPTTLHPSFWSTIDAAHRDKKQLRPLIEPMSRAELLAFYRDFMDAAWRLREPPFDDNESDGNRERSWWVVAQGRAFYEEILAHPEKMPDDTTGPGLQLRGMIARVFAEKFGMEVGEADTQEIIDRRLLATRAKTAAAGTQPKVPVRRGPPPVHELREMYRRMPKVKQLAAASNVSKTTVYRWLHAAGLL